MRLNGLVERVAGTNEKFTHFGFGEEISDLEMHRGIYRIRLTSNSLSDCFRHCHKQRWRLLYSQAT